MAALRSAAEDVPMLILRGEKSDILEKATAAKMVKKAKQAHTGHDQGNRARALAR
jgi:hypothetical protein